MYKLNDTFVDDVQHVSNTIISVDDHPIAEGSHLKTKHTLTPKLFVYLFCDLYQAPEPHYGCGIKVCFSSEKEQKQKKTDHPNNFTLEVYGVPIIFVWNNSVGKQFAAIYGRSNFMIQTHFTQKKNNQCF